MPSRDTLNAISSKRGRPSALSRENLLKICTRVALGETLRKICAEAGQPSAPAFRRAVMDDPEVREQWEIAKSERPHHLFEEAIDLAREIRDTAWKKEDTNQVTAARVAIEALREAAARLAPREYGQRPGSQVVVPVQINTTLDLSAGQPKQRQGTASVYSIDLELPAPTENPMTTLSPKGSPDDE